MRRWRQVMFTDESRFCLCRSDGRKRIYRRRADIMAAYQFKCSLDEMSVKEFYDHYKDSLPKLIMITQGYCGEVVLDTFDREQVLRIHTFSIQKRVIAKMCDGCRLPGIDGTHLSIPINYDAKFCMIKSGAKVGKEETLQDIVLKHDLPVEVQLGKSGGDTLKVGDTDKSTRQKSGQMFRISLLETHDEFFLLGNAVAGTSLYGKVTVVPVYLPDLRLSIITGFAVQPQERFDAVCREMHAQVVKNISFDDIKGNEDIAVYSDHATRHDIYYYASPVDYCHIDEGMEKGRKSKRRDGYTDLVPKTMDDNVYDIIPSDSLYNELDTKHMLTPTPVKVPPVTTAKPITTPKPMAKIPASKPPAQLPSSTSTPPKQLSALDQSPLYRAIKSKAESENENPKKEPPPPVPKRGDNTYSLRQKRPEGPIGDVPGTRDENITLVQQEESQVGQKQAAVSGKSDKINVKELDIDELGKFLIKLKLQKYTETFRDNLIDGAILQELDRDILINEFGMTKLEIIRLMKFATAGHVPKTQDT
ncbi:uncharacterized protein LOC132557211 [Ylistrum balloti]|uniref:uncharacterized protein LOC132557211 n=1 Tax=Ylistrum balloti TaxID=509963 RepID=UPI002905C23A|nr:uncharacterized protein LOC132557211 [Ylistrum balloti]